MLTGGQTVPDTGYYYVQAITSIRAHGGAYGGFSRYSDDQIQFILMQRITS